MTNKNAAFLPIGIGLGLSIGVALGVALDNVGLGLALGTAIGSGFGVALMGAANTKAKKGRRIGRRRRHAVIRYVPAQRL